MAVWSKFMTATTAAVSAFRAAYLSADAQDGGDFTSGDARRLRYDLLWAIYENSVYRSDTHAWAQAYRGVLGLYKYIRAIEAPAQEIAQFAQTHIMGGQLDPDAKEDGALPIVTPHAGLRPHLAQLWRWSNWATRKDVLTLRGSVMGDFAIRVMDDRLRERVYLELLHPGLLSDVALDPFGNVKGYTLEETRADPLRPGQTAVYREMVTREGDNVVYTTYRNGNEFGWPENADTFGNALSTWSESYGFVPLVWGKHIDIGLDYGWSEYHAGLPVFRELDDLGSALDDQIRKTVNAPWLMAGVDPPSDTPTTTRTAPAAGRPEPGRQEVPMLYGPVGAQPHALVMPLDIAGTNARIESLHAKLRRDYPELQADVQTASGDASGRALRVARQRAEAKVTARRAVYDDAVVRAQMMALAIGGMRGLFAGLSLDSYGAGALDHTIGPRPVFAVSEADRIEEETAFWGAAKAVKDAGGDVRGWLKGQGWTPAQIRAVLPDPEPQPPALMAPVGAPAGPGQAIDAGAVQ